MASNRSWGSGAEDDDDDWQEMPVLRSNAAELDEEDQKKFRYLSPLARQAHTSPTATGFSSSNATGNLLDLSEAAAAKGQDWREKSDSIQEADYTRLGLDDDPEEDSLHMRTQYLFDDDKGMTPLSQMQATKGLLSEGQRIAYVGLCRLVTREMVQALKRGGHKEMDAAVESMNNWAIKIMGRLYRHMDVNPSEQRMIEQLAEHGVSSLDLVPSLIATHTIPNPSYDPEAAQEALEEAKLERLRAEGEREKVREQGGEVEQVAQGGARVDLSHKPKAQNPSGDGGDERKCPAKGGPDSTSSEKSAEFREEDGEGDIGRASGNSPPIRSATVTGTPQLVLPSPKPNSVPEKLGEPRVEDATVSPADPRNLIDPLPHTLPGVSTTLTAADETVTLDIRWTILCDLFLAIIADSVYDARSRVLLGRCAHKLGLSWMDVVRFERRLTEALEVQEGVSQAEQDEVIEGRAKADKRRRYMMMGAAAVGGGLVIGLSAGLLAPVIGAGLAAGFTTIGVTGTSGFLAGAGGAALITTAGTVTGMNVGGKGMAKRTQSVTVFKILPLHNNKRVNVFLTLAGFMAGANDDVRLPFSVMDQSMGDVLSILWEPEMMGETGNILKILTSEVVTQIGQQVLQMTVLTALMSALQWPIMLTKLGYLIDNPWSNALDRAKAAGAVLADVLMKRHIGVRPVSLIGFSLGARAIFYALMELAKRKAYGIVQEAYLLGATVTASNKVWRDVRGVVAGRFVNAYCQKDWILGYLYRATTGGLQTVAGLSPVEGVPDVENVDLTNILIGHMAYRVQMPVILEYLGFRVTARTFDEPEDMEQDPEDDQEVGDGGERNKKRQTFFSRFRKQKTDADSVQLERKDADAAKSATDRKEAASGDYQTEDDDDEPPRLDVPHNAAKSPLPLKAPGDQGLAPDAKAPISGTQATPKAPDTFDIAAIRAEIARPVDGQSQSPSPANDASSTSQNTDMDTRAGLGGSDGAGGLRHKWFEPTSREVTTTPSGDDGAATPPITASVEDTSESATWQSANLTSSASGKQPFNFYTSASPYANSLAANSTVSFGGQDGSLSGAWGTNSDIGTTPWVPPRASSASSAFRDDPWRS